jgi:hypothetical protein
LGASLRAPVPNPEGGMQRTARRTESADPPLKNESLRRSRSSCQPGANASKKMISKEKALKTRIK